MTGKIISLSRVRKARDRDAARVRADANAVKHGRTKAERQAEAARRTQSEGLLDAHKRTEPGPDDA